MKQTRRKELSLLLIMVLCLGLTVPASAAYEYDNGKCVYELSNDPIGTVELTDDWGYTYTVLVVPDNTTVSSKTVPNGRLPYGFCVVSDNGTFFIDGGDELNPGESLIIAPFAEWNNELSLAYWAYSEAVGEQYSPDDPSPVKLDSEEGGIFVMDQSAVEALGFTGQDSTGTPSTPSTPSTSAPYVVLSPQNLTVNGEDISCEKDNIDGANYFKLRDLAYLLDGTGSQFGVGYDATTNTVTITTGTAYVPNNTELVTGVDNSSSAVLTSQTILINGVARNDLTVYNIGGSNFFQLRELGTALGFDVDYNADTNTAIVRSFSFTFNYDSKSQEELDAENEEGRELAEAAGMGTAGIHAWSEANGSND